MEKGIEATHEITSREIDTLRKERLNSMEENSRLREIISKKDNEIADLTNPPPPPPPMNDSSQKLPGWLSDDLRPLVYECGLEDKVMELDKSFARENILYSVLVTGLDRSSGTVLDWTVQSSGLYSIGTGPSYTNFSQLEYFISIILKYENLTKQKLL